MLLDEATSAIDPTTEKHVSLALAGLVADKTLIVVAHKLSTISAADQVDVIDDGRVVEVCTPAELLQAGGLSTHLHEARRRDQGWRLGRFAGPSGGTSADAEL